MIEDDIKAFAAVIREATVTIKAFNEMLASTPAPAKPRKRRTKAELEAEKLEKLDASSSAKGETATAVAAPPPPEKADNSSALPAIGVERIVDGYVIPGYIAIGNEHDYIASVVAAAKYKRDQAAKQAEATGQTNVVAADPIVEAALTPISLEEFNAKLAKYSHQKGFLVVTGVLEKVGCPVNEIDPERYDELLAQLEAAEST